MSKAIEYAQQHGSYVYDLPLKKSPSRNISCISGEGCDAACGEFDDGIVVDQELLPDFEGI